MDEKSRARQKASGLFLFGDGFEAGIQSTGSLPYLRPVFMYTSPAMTLLNASKSLYNQYPRQFWLMITGNAIATAGGGMIWPFALIYDCRSSRTQTVGLSGKSI